MKAAVLTSTCIFASLLGLASLAGCSSGPSAADACAAVAAARCQRLAACSASDMTRRYGDEATCETRQKLACTAGLAAPSTGATPDSVESCATSINAESCTDFLGKDPTEQCMPQTGTIAQGSACEFASQCATTFCAVATDENCGTCQPVPQPGQSCATQGCGPNMVCVPSTQLCQVPVAVNGACSDAMPCADGLACVGADPAVSGTCMTEVTTANAACDQRRITGPDCNADDDLTCDTVANMCVTMPIVGANMTCGRVNGVQTRCAAGSTCVRPANSPTGTCVAPAGDGQACDTVNGPDCFYPAKCIVSSGGGTAGTCELPGTATCS